MSLLKSLFCDPIEKCKEIFQNRSLSIGEKLIALFRKGLDARTLDEIENLLYSTDMSPTIAGQLVSQLKGFVYTHPNAAQEELLNFLTKEILKYIPSISGPKITTQPHVIFIIGSNGYGKTTSVAKLAYHYKEQGKKVLVVAADTFRAAAVEQLQIWAERIGVECVAGKNGGDPSAVVYDGICAAKARNVDVVLIDTAGRLHTKEPLLKELEKLYKTAGKAFPGAPHETLLVLDATTGKSALTQARVFQQYAPITGLFVTKFDSTARAGTIIALHSELKLPTQWLGLGEGVEDLIPFVPEEFVQSLLSSN